jgi:uncharacterized protein (DUF302 family)
MSTRVSVEKKVFLGVRVRATTSLAFDDVLRRLRSLTGLAPAADFVANSQAPGTEADYARNVRHCFVGKSGFMLFFEMDHGGWIGRFGIRRKLVRWIFGNPLIAITMLRRDLSAGLFVPVELLLMEQADGRGSVVIYVRPSSLIAIGKDAGLRAAAKALDRKVEALVARATKPTRNRHTIRHSVAKNRAKRRQSHSA